MEIKKILIANRGEIAIRIIRTCKEMGIKTVALCPQKGEEENFLETKLADEYYFLEEEGILGYLDQRKIIEIAKRAGVQAIHPGYGFLAENGNFADLCQKNNIKFIGPRGDTLRKLGNKIEATKIAKNIGFPLLPGFYKSIQNEKECLELARKIGTPFILKAVNGGGGIGIEIIEKIEPEKLMAVFQTLKRETAHAFGSDQIFIAKFLPNPHHIEIQILGDGKGKVLHFGERECSVQRRNQKLIEEAPSPFLDKKLREKMSNLAMRMGQSLKYENLGTIEFLVGEDKKFYFLEVNSRLQVEHPITELITGFDLVEQQIRIARGEALDLKQKDIKFSGWAMEFRIYAEDALNNFQPQAGIITKYLPPGGKGIEIHSFCQPEQKIFPYFDNLISKLVIFAENRKLVIERAKRAFDEYLIEGVPTLIPFYRVLLENKNFLEGKINTSFIEKEGIIQTLGEKYPKIEFPKEIKTEKIIGEKELAVFLARLYQNLKKEESKESETSKWKLMERMQMFFEE